MAGYSVMHNPHLWKEGEHSLKSLAFNGRTNDFRF